MLGIVLLALLPLGHADGPSQDAKGAPKGAARETDGNRLVRVALHADKETVEPGKTFQLCVELIVKPGWHVYWENAGDAGVPTHVDLTGPEGFEIGPVRFPCPTRHESDGDIVSYIHEGRVLLLAEVRAPAKLAPGAELSFRVECDWLVCTDYCLPGSGTGSIELAAGGAGAKAANAKLFADALAGLPRTRKEVLGDVQPVLERDGDTTRVTLEVPGASKLEYFPHANRTTVLVKRTVTATPKGARIELVFEQTNGARDVDWRGVLWIQDEKGSRSCLQESWLPEKS